MRNIILALTLLLSSQTLFGADEFLEGEKRDIFRDVASELRCPTCTGVSVLESQAEFSVQIQDLVKEKLRDGKSKDEILDFFVERYGSWILRVPSTKGFNIVAWAVPICLLALGPVLVWFLFWRRKSEEVEMRSRREIVEQMKSELNKLRELEASK